MCFVQAVSWQSQLLCSSPRWRQKRMSAQGYRLGYSYLSVCNSAVLSVKYMQQVTNVIYEGDRIQFRKAGFWFIPPHVPSEDRKYDLCLRLQVPAAHREPVPRLFFGQYTRWCACLLPFTIFPFSLPECPTHTWPIVFWYDLSNAEPSDAHVRTCTHTEALSITASLFTHWDTLTTFIAPSQWGTLSVEKSWSLDPRPPLHQPQALSWYMLWGCGPACLIIRKND